MFNLNGKIAMVSGASSGLGEDAAIAYAENGADVVLLARRKEKLESVASSIEKLGRKALPIPCDVTDEGSVKKAVETAIREFKRIDILLNNAGIAVGGGVTGLTIEEWNKSISTNVSSIFLMCKYVVPNMIEQSYGKIVNISSINAVQADKNDLFIRHGYNASKAAVIGLTHGMACSYGKYNITVNAIGPALFETEMTSNTLFKSDDFLKAYNAQCPMNRAGRKGELNGTILYFSTEASSYVTGQFIIVDGGISLV